MVMTRSQWVLSMALEHFDNPFISSADKRFWDYGKVFTVGTVDAATWQTFPWAGFKPPVQYNELQPITTKDALELRKFVLTVIKFASGYMLSYEWEEDNKNIPGALQQFAREMGNGFGYAHQKYITESFDYAFTPFSRNYTSTAGEALCQTHALTNSDLTYSNYGGAFGITHDYFWNACRYFSHGILAENGILIVDTPANIVFHPENEEYVAQLLQNPDRPGTANRDKNLLMNKFKPCPNPLLANQNHWFVTGSMHKQHAYFKIRHAPDSEWDVKRGNQGKINYCWSRVLSGIRECRFIIGFDPP